MIITEYTQALSKSVESLYKHSCNTIANSIIYFNSYSEKYTNQCTNNLYNLTLSSESMGKIAYNCVYNPSKIMLKKIVDLPSHIAIFTAVSLVIYDNIYPENSKNQCTNNLYNLTLSPESMGKVAYNCVYHPSKSMLEKIVNLPSTIANFTAASIIMHGKNSENQCIKNLDSLTLSPESIGDTAYNCAYLPTKNMLEQALVLPTAITKIAVSGAIAKAYEYFTDTGE